MHGDRVKLSHRVQPHDLQIFVDPEQMTQLFLNLAINACEAMGYEGELVISAEQTSDRSTCDLKVQDSGRVDLKLPAILINAFRAPDGSEAVITVNITNKPQTGRLHWHGDAIDLRLSPWEVRLIKP